MRNLATSAIKWTTIAVWFDLSSRFIGAPFDYLLSLTPYLAWLNGYTNIITH